MSLDKDYAPLSAACVRALTDKIYEKRKAAAQEIEKMVRDLSGSNKEPLRRLFTILGQEFALSQNINTRRGGLIGLAAAAIGLKEDSVEYMEDMLKPILLCMNDNDSRVRYSACEALYNVVKIMRGNVLPHFNELFSILSRLIADPDQHVKNACELVDRLLKDIVTETASFDLVSFIPLLRERIYSKNPFARQFIITWISVLDAVPDIDMIIFLPEFLDGLFAMLSDSATEIKKMCDTLLGEFLHRILRTPEKVDFAAMTNILVTHADASDELLRFTALVWLKEFVNLSGRQMIPFASGILTVVLPAISGKSEERSSTGIREVASGLNASLMALIKPGDDQMEVTSPAILETVKITLEGEVIAGGDQVIVGDTRPDVSAIVEVLAKEIPSARMGTELACLRWFHHLLTTIPRQTFQHMREIFPALLRALSDAEHEVVLVALEVIARVVSDPVGSERTLDDVNLGSDHPPWLPELVARASPHRSPYFVCFMIELLRLDGELLERRGPLIIRQLCILLNPEDIYRTLAEALTRHEDLDFVSMMVKTLNSILFTSPELFRLRKCLKELETKDSCELLCCLYKSWCHCPVAAVALCLLSQNYQHAMKLIQHFEALDVTVEFLVEVDKLVQLLESPIFTYLRLHLLDPQHSPVLVQALYGLLMLLPQSEAFHVLRRRLDCLPGNKGLPHPMAVDPPTPMKKRLADEIIPFDELLQTFTEVQARRVKHAQEEKVRSMLVKLKLTTPPAGSGK